MVVMIAKKNDIETTMLAALRLSRRVVYAFLRRCLASRTPEQPLLILTEEFVQVKFFDTVHFV